MDVKWHTEGRRQPILVGKDASGRRIPGGPYVVWQGLALPIAPLLWGNRDMWAGDLSGLAVLVVVAAVTATAFWLIGQIDWSGRNPIVAVPAAAAALTRVRPSGARLNRRPIRRRRPVRRLPRHTIWHTQTSHRFDDDTLTLPDPIDLPPTPAEEPVDLTLPSLQPVPAAPADPPVRMSPLEQFLSAAGKV